MATRLYTTADAAGISPAVASGWEDSTGLDRHAASTATADYAQVLNTSQNGTGVANDDACHFQMVYGPLSAGSFNGTTDTVKGQFAAREVNANSDGRAQMTIRLIAPNGTTVRFTALALDTAALSSEFVVAAGNTSMDNRKFPRGGATTLTAGSWNDGDYVVIEVGHRNHGTNTSGIRIASGGTARSGDLAENETTTIDATGSSAVGWVEFSKTLAPYVSASGGNAAGTGTGRNAAASVKTGAEVSTGTGTANNPAISFLPPPRTVLINNVDYTDSIRLDSFSFTECANNGEVGIGGFDVFDSASSLDIPALKSVIAEEPQAGQANKRMFTGFTHDRTTERGVQKVAGVREWGVEITDLNVLFDDFVLTAADNADRGIETDYARMVWLLTTRLNTVGGVATGVVPNSNTVTMEATDYRGRRARDVASECLEASGKLCFIYDYGAGRKLYYDVATGTSLSSTSRISDVAADIDSAVTWAPYSAPVVKRSPDRIYSKVHLTYTGGTVSVNNATTASNYRAREAAVQDMSITTSALATAKANALLTGASTELLEVTHIAIAVPAANVNDIRQGQRVQIKLTRHGISAFTYYRVTRRTVTPLGDSGGVSDVHYLISMTLASDVLASANGGRGADDIPQNRSNSNDDGATVIIDRGGITVTDGSLTLTDEFGSTVMQSTGFAGTWADFIRLGLYNARFQNTLAGSIQEGRTSDLPFWTVDLTGAGVLTGLPGGGVTATWGASTDKVELLSDRVPVQPGGIVESAFAILSNRAAGNLTANVRVYWYKADGSDSASPFGQPADYFGATSVTSLLWYRDALVVPSDAFFAKWYVGLTESSHNASNSISLYAAKLQDMPVQQTPYLGVAGGSTVGLSPGSGTVNDYDPGSDAFTLLQLTLGGALSLTGMVAPVSGGYRLRYINNYGTAFALTLKHENAGSSAANRFSCPGNVDYVVSVNGWVLLIYNPTGSRWQVLNKS